LSIALSYSGGELGPERLPGSAGVSLGRRLHHLVQQRLGPPPRPLRAGNRDTGDGDSDSGGAGDGEAGDGADGPRGDAVPGDTGRDGPPPAAGPDAPAPAPAPAAPAAAGAPAPAPAPAVGGSPSASPGPARRLGVPVLLSRTRLATALRRGLLVRPACTVACAVRVELRVSRATAKRLGLRSTRVATGRLTRRATGRRAVRPRFTRAAAQRLRRARTLRVTAVTTVTDAAGRRLTARRAVTLLR